MSTTEISVIMPAYNAASFLVESITSVINQSFTSWELIVVDDGSKDNTAEIVANFQSDKRIKLLQQANGGVSSARNAGIKIASGNYITFLDADDSYLPDNLKTKYDCITSNSTIEYVYSDLLVCDFQMNAIFVEKGVPAEEVRNSVMSWKSENIPGLSSNIMVRSSALRNKEIYFDTHLSNCADRYYKILLTDRCKGSYIPKALAKYRNTPGSMSKNVELLEHDELYILHRIKEKNIIPEGGERDKVFAKVYLMLSGSWYKDAGKPGRAIKFGLKAINSYPGIFFKILSKGLSVLSGGRK